MKGKQIWTSQEDQRLKCLVLDEQYAGNWSTMAQKINMEFPYKKRTAKQCRERYINYVAMDENQRSVNDWTPEQTESLFYLFEKWGSRWTKISQEIAGKSENCVKNRFYGSLRKALRKMNRAAKNLVKKFKKQVKYESITRIIDASQGLFRLQSPLKEESEELSRKILALAKKNEEEMGSQQAQQLIIEINRFNMATRSYKSKKKIKSHNPVPRDLQKSPSFLKNSTTLSSLQKQISSNLDDLQVQQTSSTVQQNPQPNPQSQTQVNKKEEEKMQIYSSHDGLINFEEEGLGRIDEERFDRDFQELLDEILSPLQCEAWM